MIWFKKKINNNQYYLKDNFPFLTSSYLFKERDLISLLGKVKLSSKKLLMLLSSFIDWSTKLIWLGKIF